tara:strand:+ start:126 stop:737 length:612 start_codon:yes stop_codon:yes gene_type:complete
LKKNKISKNWINKQRRDIYVKKSKIEGYRSRAVYKLEEINTKFKIFSNGSKIIDLGAAPGSWSQYISKKVKNNKTIAIDLNEMEKIENITTVKGDFTHETIQLKIIQLLGMKVDVILSDMAVNTTGNKDLDSIQTGELCLQAMAFSKKYLSSNGKFISKIFMGSSFNEIVKTGKEYFKEVKVFKPKSSRKDSKENFIICRYLR